MIKKIEWIKRGMTANNGLHMQEICDQIADATGIENYLQKPEIAPENTQIVAVDNTNTQTMLNIGDGLSVENGTLKASGGTGGKKYFHYIEILNEESKIDIYFNFVSANANFTDIASLLREMPQSMPLSCSMGASPETQIDKLPLYAIAEGTDLYVQMFNLSTRMQELQTLSLSTFSISGDKVYEI